MASTRAVAGAAASPMAAPAPSGDWGAFDAASFAAAKVILFAVALAACGLPARRATGVDPSAALRTE